MLWFTVWTVLVVGTLVGAFFLLRHLYRAARALLAELERAGDALAAVAERTEELTEAAAAAQPVAPVDLRDPGPARERLALAAVATQRRRAEREVRRQATYRRWQSFSR